MKIKGDGFAKLLKCPLKRGKSISLRPGVVTSAAFPPTAGHWAEAIRLTRRDTREVRWYYTAVVSCQMRIQQEGASSGHNATFP